MMKFDDMLEGATAWRRGLLDLLTELYAIVDYTVMARDKYIQTLLFHTGHEWAGDPEEPDPYHGIPLHRMHIQGRAWMYGAMGGFSEPTPLREQFLAYRDRIMSGTQNLFLNHPDMLYLLCMHAERRLRVNAEARDVDPANPTEEHTLFEMYRPSRDARRLLSRIYPELSKGKEEWELIYDRTL